MKKKTKEFDSGRAAIGLLLFLAALNAVWLGTSRHRGALIAFIAYFIVSILCLRYLHFRSGIIVGLCGFGIHFYELIAHQNNTLKGIDFIFFYANLLLPIPLGISSYLASRANLSSSRD